MLRGIIDKYFIKNPHFRRAVTRALEGEREVVAELFGTQLHVHTVREHGYLRASRAKTRYSVFGGEAEVLLHLAMLLADGDTFVDVGANVGLFSATLARRRLLHGGQTEFVAFEANPDTVERLRRTAEPVGVRVHHTAVSDREGELLFVGGAVSHVFTAVQHTNAYSIPSERVIVPCRRLDSFDLPGNSLVIKIDVEGHERQVIDGASALFAAGRVKAVYIDGFEDKSIPAYLISNGFQLFDGRTLTPALDEVFSLLAVRPR